MTSWTDEAHARLQDAGQRIGRGAGGRDRVPRRAALLPRRAGDPRGARRSAARRSGSRASTARVDGLVEQGLLQRVDFGDGIARYEPVRSGHEHHHHLVCDDCGKVETFHDAPLERAIEAIERQTGYHVVSHDVVLRGACGDCRAEES